MAEPDDTPGVLDRLRTRFPWFDRIMRAQERYDDRKGDFYAAGVTYFTVFALFPLLMVGFAAAGFVLASRPQLMADIELRIKETVSGDLGTQLVQLMDSAISSRGTVGVIGLATAAWAGLGWMSNLREALSQMWEQRTEKDGFLRTKLSDLAALVSVFVAMVLTIALTALANKSVMTRVLDWVGLHDITTLGRLLGAVSWLLSALVSWLLFTWMIARLPREPVAFGGSVQGGLLAAVGFEIFKQVGSLYLGSVMHGPAGATFGPVLGLMVFAYVTARLILFATAWAATSAESMLLVPVVPPGPAAIAPRVQVREGVGVRGAVAAFAAGAIGAFGLSRWRRRSR
ncbi:inner membrane protein YhjD [Mycolicibacterium fluoranthenivorans]|uniref:Inner membrane protein YhjD n=1 Tax=Mycolicibacterium fluoranthenivorans TaxID=258505 RepID=A0A7G8PKQ4_9MYCO|nr:inner membrane protein YhjD [Mycolicibacterium fluoranthenivorans]QNJ94920.1 inner membrane protein YhjD [Mycolicibacterium fluoranthenivorans]